MIKIDWTLYSTYVDAVAAQIRESKVKYKNVYGIPRGGLIPAVMLSHKLNISLLADERYILPATLVVDDISDTGKTLVSKILKTKHFAIDVAVIVLNKSSCFKPKYFAFKNDANEWIEFPYEMTAMDTVSENKKGSRK